MGKTVRNWKIGRLIELTRGKHGERRKAFLRYLATHPGATPYQIAKEFYPGGAGLSHKAVRLQLKRISDFKDGITPVLLERTKNDRGASHYSLTREARGLCGEVGISLPSGLGEELVNKLNGLVKEPLPLDEKVRLRELVPPEVINTLFEISDKCHEEFRKLSGLPVNDDTRRAFLGVWIYEAEKRFMEYRQDKKFIADGISRIFGPSIGKIARKNLSHHFSMVDKRLSNYLVALPLVKSKPPEIQQKITKFSLLLDQLAKENSFLREIREGVQANHVTRVGMAIIFSIYSFPPQKGK